MEGLYRKISGTFFIKVLGLGTAFLLQIILGRTLKPELYGHYTIFITYINVLSIIAVLGMDKNLIKEVAKVSDDKTQNSGLLSFAIKTSFLLFIILSIFIVVFHNEISVPLNLLHLFLLMLLIKVIILILDGFLQGKGLVVKVTFLNELINNFLKIIFFIIFIKLEINGLYSALYSFIISEIIAVIIRSSIIKKLLGNHISPKDSFSRFERMQFIKYSMTMALITGIGLLLQNIDKIMIAYFLDLSSVGIYKVAQNYVTLIGVFITPFIAFWPVISKLYNENKIAEIQNEMRKIVKIVTYLVIPMFFIFLFLSEKLLLIFGREYVLENAKVVLIVLGLAFLIDAISGPIGSILTMTKYAKYVLINNIIALTLNVVLNFIFIKMFGIIGVAIGTGISIVANNLISILQVKVLLGIFSYDYKNIAQIFVLLIFNYILCQLFTKFLFIENTYLYLVVFAGLMYLFNGLILAFNYKKTLKNIYYQCLR